MEIKDLYQSNQPSKPAPQEPAQKPKMPKVLYSDLTPATAVTAATQNYGKTVFALKPRLDKEQAKARFVKLVGRSKNVSAAYREAVLGTPAELLMELCHFEVFHLDVAGYTTEEKSTQSYYRNTGNYNVTSTVVDGEVHSTVTPERERYYSHTQTKVVQNADPKKVHASHLSNHFYKIFEADSSHLLSQEEFLAANLIRFDEKGDATPNDAYLTACAQKFYNKGKPYGIKHLQTVWFPVWRVRVTVDGREFVSYVSDEPSPDSVVAGVFGIDAPVIPRKGLQALVALIKSATSVIKTFAGICSVFMLMWIGSFQKPIPALLIGAMVLNIICAVACYSDTWGETPETSAAKKKKPLSTKAEDIKAWTAEMQAIKEKEEYIIALKTGAQPISVPVKALVNFVLSVGSIALFTVLFVMSL